MKTLLNPSNTPDTKANFALISEEHGSQIITLYDIEPKTKKLLCHDVELKIDGSILTISCKKEKYTKISDERDFGYGDLEVTVENFDEITNLLNTLQNPPNFVYKKTGWPFNKEEKTFVVGGYYITKKDFFTDIHITTSNWNIYDKR